MILALAGNPNCGKTTLFNALTGANARTGNFPGVTVTRSESVCRARPKRRRRAWYARAACPATRRCPRRALRRWTG